MSKVVWGISFLLIIFLILIYPHKSFSFDNKLASTTKDNKLLELLGVPTFHLYGGEAELTQPSTMAITFDHKGYLWIATQEGAAYYNGHKWVFVSMPNNLSKDIRAIMVNAAGDILFGSLGGGVHFLQSGKWVTFDKKSLALPNDNVRSLLETTSVDGTHSLWVGTDDGLARYKDKKWMVFDNKNTPLVNNTINALLETTDKNGHKSLWIATQGGLARYEQDKWTVFDNNNSPLPNNNITALAESTSINGGHALWIGTQGGLARYEQDKWTVFDSKNSSLLINTVNTLLETTDRKGHRSLWVGTFGGGLGKYVEDQWFVYNSKNTLLPNNNVRSLVKSCSEGHCTIWIGTLGGLAKYEEDKWNTFTTRNSPLPGNDTRAFLESRSEDGQSYYWIATEGGLVRYEKNNWTLFNTTNSLLPSNYVTTLLESRSADNQKTLWIGTAGGLAKYVNGSWTIFNTTNSPLPTNIIITLLESISAEGRRTLWIGTARGGLAKYEEGKWTVFNTTNSPLPNNYVGVFLERTSRNGHRTLWIGTYGGGLAKYEDEKWTIFNASNSSVPNNSVLSLKEITSLNGTNTLWVGTSAGLGFFDLDSEKWVNSSDKNLLNFSKYVVSAIQEDKQKRIYICTYQNIVRLTPSRTNTNESQYQTYTFTTDDGLAGNGVVPLGTMLDTAGYLWVGSLAGISILDTSKTVEDNTLKPLLMEKIFINGQNYSQYKTQQELLNTQGATLIVESLDGLELGYNENNITFEYALLSYMKENETIYQTQLEGFDKQPSDWVKDYKRIYTNLNKGDYVFKVLAKDYNGNLSGPLTVRFKIKPAIWYTWWAYTFYAFSFVSIAFSLGYYQVNKTKQKAFLDLQRQKEQSLLKESQLRAEAAELQAQAAEAQARSVEEEHKRKSQELAYARQIQLSLLPRKNIFLDKIEIVGQMITASEVGGDYYDFIKIDDNRYLLVIGDATGHGVGAGLVVGMCKALVISAVNSLSTSTSTLSLVELIQSFNTALKGSLADRRIGMCLCMAIVDISKMTLEICSTGMPFPFLFDKTNSEIKSLEMKGQPLGFLKKIKLDSRTIKLNTGDSLIFISDGFDERKNPQNQIWGYQKVKAELLNICKQEQRAETIVERLITASNEFALGYPNKDDMTIIVLYIKEASTIENTNGKA